MSTASTVCSNTNITSLRDKGELLPTARRDELAWAMLLHRFMREGLKLSPREVRGEIGNRIKELNDLVPGLHISTEEAMKFVEEVTLHLLRETTKGFQKKA